MAGPNEQIAVLDRDSMIRLWLADKVASGKMSQGQAEALWRRHSTNSHFIANYFSVGGDIALLTKLARDLKTPIARCYFKTYGGKLHIVFKGYPGVRQILTGTRYGVQHAKVVGMGLGRAGVVTSARSGTIVSVLFLTAWNVIDYFMRDDATLGQLLGGIAGDVTKAAIGGGVGAMAGALAVGTVVGTFALGPLVVAVAVGIGVGLALDWVDNRFQLTAKLQAALDDALRRFQAEMERRRQNLLDRGAQALGALAHQVIDLAVDWAVETAKREVQRRFMPIIWRAVPRF